MILYHGSNNYIEDFIEPRTSYHYKPYVYATSDPLYALVRCGKFDINNFAIKEEYDGKIYTLVEIKKGAFKKAFDTEGWLYYVDDTNFIQNEETMPNEFVSQQKASILERIYIPNIYKEIKKFNIYNLISYNKSEEYWKTVNGGKEGYLKRRKERLEKLKSLNNC